MLLAPGLATLAAALVAGAPLTLDEALAEAARASPGVRLAQSDLARADTDVYGSYAGVLPRLDLTATFGHTFTGEGQALMVVPTSLLPPVLEQQSVQVPATDQASYTVGLAFQLPIFDGARSWNSIRQAKAAGEVAGRALDEASLTVAFETTRRFLALLKAQESLRVLRDTAARSEDIVRQSRSLFEAGRGGRLDVLTAEGNLGRDRIAVEQADAQRLQAEADLAAVLGRDAGAPLAVVAPVSLAGPTAPSDEPPAALELLARARRARPLLAARAASVRASELGRSVARGAWFPSLAARATYDREGPSLGGTDGVYGDPTRQYTATAQLVLSWNLFDGRRTRAEEERAAIAERRARIEADQAEQQVAAEIARARAALVAQQRSAGLAAQNLAAAEQGVALARERLAAGVSSQLEVRDASLKLTQAQLDLITARIDQVVARADLNRAVGGTLAAAPPRPDAP